MCDKDTMALVAVEDSGQTLSSSFVGLLTLLD